MAGYDSALANAGYPAQDVLKLCVRNRIHQALDVLLSHEELKIDGVIAAEDGLAVATFKYEGARGIRVLKKLSIMGYNNLSLFISM